MRKKFVKTLAAALAIAICVLPSGAIATNSSSQKMIRVGLASSSYHNALGVLEAAHLQNASGGGAGFRFGYYDNNLNFVELSRTDSSVTDIAVLKAQTLYYGYSSSLGKNTYSSSIKSNIAVGTYHLQLIGSYTSFRTASMRAKQLGGFVAWINGVYYVRFGAYVTREEAQKATPVANGCTIVSAPTNGMNVVKNGTNQILFQYDSTSKPAMAIQPDVSGASDVQSWFSGYKYRGGFTYQRIGGGGLTVVNVLPMEDYVRGVICYEMGPNWPLEALKAQAICARTYAARRGNYHNDLGFDVCNSSYCQVYRGLGSGSGNAPSATSDKAVADTKNQVAMYKSSLALTAYAASHGGASESANYIWGSNMNTYPYLCGVIDPYEKNVSNPYSSWTVEYTTASLTSRLQSYGYGKGTTVKSMDLTYSNLGNIIKVKVNFADGTSATITPRTSPSIISLFKVKSIRFNVNGVTAPAGSGERTVTVSGSSYVFRGAGLGHQVGMSQYGANAMARAGFTGADIVKFYFPGVTIGNL